MSCESCIAARQAETAALTAARQKAKQLANDLKQPIFLLIEDGAYTPSTTQQPNTVEVILPDR